MKSIQESVLKALAGVLPEDVVAKLSDTVTSTLDEATKEIEADYQAQLNEAYEELRKQKLVVEQEAEQGYAQAFDLICEYKDRLALKDEEHKRMIDEGFNEAWEMLEKERRKNDDLEADLYREYEEKLKDVQKFLVRKLDQFLPTQGAKYYEAARKDLLNDPVFAEHKAAFGKMLEAAATVLTDEDFATASGEKAEQTARELEDLKKQVQVLEGRNMRMKMDNDRLTETVRRTKADLLTEQKVERKARTEKAKKVEGRGEVEPKKDRQVIIGEYNSGEPVAARQETNLPEEAKPLAEYWNFMAGIDTPGEDE